MKCLMTLLFSVLLSLGDAAYAQESPKSWEGTISARTLNVRAGPGQSQKIVGRLKRGDRVVAFDEEGRWIHIRDFDGSVETGWISRAFINLPKNFMAPAFGDLENAFLEWASARGDLSVVSVEAENQLSLVLDQVSGVAVSERVAREVACSYRAQLSVDGPVTATVWPEAGAQDGWIVHVSCP
jgi:SH3-like domain-containing protein